MNDTGCHLRRTLLLAALLPAPTLAADCVKEVFRNYCLGGPVAELLETRPPEGESSDKGLIRYHFLDQNKPVIVSAREGRIVAVSRDERPGSYLNFTDWKVKLVRLYGRAEDQSSFPSYAASRSARLNAINAGRGIALVSWPQDGWQVALRWDTPDYIRLEYRLDEAATPAEEEGL